MALKFHICIEINARLALLNLYYKTSELSYYKAFNFNFNINNMYNKILHMHRHLVCLEYVMLCNSLISSFQTSWSFLRNLQIWKCIVND